MPKFQDLTGQKFGRLTVIKRVENSKYKETRWLCQCECGNKKIIYAKNLKKGFTLSCGCLQKENKIKNNITHNLSYNKIYRVYLHMKERCYNKNNKSYKNYGGRGITVCQEWLNDIRNFYSWAISNGYNEKAKFGKCTIDRIDVNGNYEPNNCRWVDIKTQSRNKTNNHLITYNGETHCITEWEEILNFNKDVLKQRINKYKWSIEKAFTTPVRKIKKSTSNI